MQCNWGALSFPLKKIGDFMNFSPKIHFYGNNGFPGGQITFPFVISTFHFYMLCTACLHLMTKIQINGKSLKLAVWAVSVHSFSIFLPQVHSFSIFFLLAVCFFAALAALGLPHSLTLTHWLCWIQSLLAFQTKPQLRKTDGNHEKTRPDQQKDNKDEDKYNEDDR